jgi:hypothetical protein
MIFTFWDSDVFCFVIGKGRAGFLVLVAHTCIAKLVQ